MRATRTIVFLLVCFGLLCLAILMLSKIFSSSGSTVKQTTDISSYARSGTAAQYTVDGPVVQNETHRMVRITVDQTQSMIELVSGYDGTVIRQEVYANTAESYRTFLLGLDNLGFTLGRKSTSSEPERGRCPLGNRYIYKLTDAGNDVFRFWSTSCSTGTFEGKPSSVAQLFQKQVPPQTYSDIYNQFSD
jgi:hypothetical protein